MPDSILTNPPQGTPQTPLDAPVYLPAADQQAPPYDWLAESLETPPVQPPEFLRVNDRTVYLTPEAARKGFEDHQAYIQRLQSENAQLRNLAQPPAREQQAFSATQALEASVRSNNPQPFETYIEAAVKKAAQSESQRMFQQAMAPLAPVIGYANFEKAVNIAASSPVGDPNIPAFVKSEAFRDVVKNYPSLANGIRQAQFDPQFAERDLPEMLGIAYKLAKAKHPQQLVPQGEGNYNPVPGSTAPIQPGGNAAAPGGRSIKDVNWFGPDVDWSRQSG